MGLRLIFISGLSSSTTSACMTAALRPILDQLSTSASPPFLVQRIVSKTGSAPHAALVLASSELAQLFLAKHRRPRRSGIHADGRELRLEDWAQDRPAPREAKEWWRKTDARRKSRTGGGGREDWEEQEPVPILAFAFGHFRGEGTFVTGEPVKTLGGRIAYERLRHRAHLVVRTRTQGDGVVAERAIVTLLENVESMQARTEKYDLFVTLRHPPAVETKRTAADSGPGRRERDCSPLVGNTLRISFPSASDRIAVILRAKREGVAVGKGSVVILKQPLAADLVQQWMRSHACIPVAFQLELMLSNGHLDASQALSIIPDVKKMLKRRGEAATERILVRLANRFAQQEKTSLGMLVLGDSDVEVDDEDGLLELGEISRPPYRGLSDLRKLLAAEEDAFVSRPSPFSDLDPHLDLRQVVIHPTRLSLIGKATRSQRTAFELTNLSFAGPLPSESNSILRKYHQPSQFIRVSVREENDETFREQNGSDVAGLLELRVGAIMRTGLELCGRRFEFLAWSSSSLKEHTAYYVAPFKDSSGSLVTAERIRTSIGDFAKIRKNPARYMARIAQAFSVTRPSITLLASQVFTIPDIETVDHERGTTSCHTDGVGLISVKLAEQVDEAYRKLLSPSAIRRRVRPTVYQIRLGGSKGLVSIDPTLDGSEICLRPSMTKFSGTSLTLDICSDNPRPLPAYLNRPLILLLESLGVDPSTIIALQENTLRDINRATKSFTAESSYVEELGLAQAAKLAQTLRLLASHLPRKSACEPFLDAALSIVALHARRELKYRGRIPLPGCWNLVGVADPGQYLQPGEVYACIHEPGKEPVYLNGPIAISRSPTMHPGDIQLVRAVGKIPDDALARFSTVENAVVFSSQGPRSLPSCLAGGDLDGDLYLLITSPSLFPTRWEAPASYEPSQMKTLDRDATIDDGIDFFLEHVLQDRTARVATAHLAIADKKTIFSPECLDLAAHHSDAVDYAKSGTPVKKDAIPRVALRPDYATRDIERKTKGEDYYESERVLGVLFRRIESKALTYDRSRANLHDRPSIDPGGALTAVLERALRPHLWNTTPSAKLLSEFTKLIRPFATHLRVVCRSQGALAVSEEEAFVGIVAGAGAQEDRSRRDLAMRMRERTAALFDLLRKELEGEELGPVRRAKRAWAAWSAARGVGGDKKTPYGVATFAWIAMGVLLESLVELDD